MEITDITSKLPWQGSMGRRLLSDIRYAVVHHDGALAFDGHSDIVPRYVSEANYHIGKGWKHIGYTFKIARDGKVYQTLPLNEIGVHAGNYKYFKSSLGICLDGSFDKQSASVEQLRALRDLMDHLANHRPDMPNLLRGGFYAHKEVRLLPTYCPGPIVAAIAKNFRTAK